MEIKIMLMKLGLGTTGAVTKEITPEQLRLAAQSIAMRAQAIATRHERVQHE